MHTLCRKIFERRPNGFPPWATCRKSSTSEYRRRMRVEAKMRVLIQQLAAFAILSMVAAAQTPTLKTRTREDREREFQTNHRIVLNVQVTDDSGKPVTDLEAKDFTVFDNHEPRKLAAFHVIDGEAMNDATEVVILLDAVNSTAEALEAQKFGIFKFLAESHSALPYPTTFVLWSNGHLKATTATRERNAVGKAFVSMTKGIHSNACGTTDGSVAKATADDGPGASGSTEAGAHEAEAANCIQVHFKDSLAALDGIAQQQRHIGGRTILVWVGAGWPLLSDDDIAQMSPKVRKSYSDELVTILNDMRNSQVTLDVLAAHETTPELRSADPQALTARTAAAPDFGPGGLAVPRLARQSGGRVITDSNDIPGDLGRLLNDADWYYALSMNPPPSSNGAELRSLDVKVNRPGLNVRTMTAYYTEPF